MKKQQIKGCGSVDRPSPELQRPAEPVASGFFGISTAKKSRSRFETIGVKLWVAGREFFRCGAILQGVRIGVAEFSCFRQGKQSARLSSLAQNAGLSPEPPSFFSLLITRQGHRKNCAGINKEKDFKKLPAQGRCKSTKKGGTFSPFGLEHTAGHREHISGSVGG